MKNKFLCNCRIPMNIQFFAEGDDAGAEGGNGGGTGGEEDKGGEHSPSFDEFLKGEGNQAEFDRRVQKAVSTAVSRAQDKWKILADDKASEAEKLAKMTKDEKDRYMQQKREKELTAREADVTRRELEAEAKGTLAEKGLSSKLSEILNYTDAESCKKSIEMVEKTFREAVEKAVEEKLKGGKPPRKASGADEQKMLEAQVLELMSGK